MQMKKCDGQHGRIGRILLAAGIVALIAVAVALLLRGSAARREQAAVVAEGVTYLRNLESRDTAEIEAAVKAVQKETLEAQRAARMQELLERPSEVWSHFEDYVLLGDSRAVGFYFYKCLPQARVLAEGGATIRNVAKHMQEIKVLNPSSVFLCFGLNDVSIGFWPTPESYAEEYLQVIQSLQQEIPGVTVYVSGILPARDPAFEKSEKWRQIPQYSAKVEEMCAENEIPFVNVDELAEEYSELWDPDGIHLRREFYPYWGANLIMEYYEHQ